MPTFLDPGFDLFVRDPLAAFARHFAQLCDAPAEIPTDRAEMIRIMREARLYVGEGGIDVSGILAHVPPCVYSIELPNKELHDEMGYAEHATRCLETLKAYLAAHPASGAQR